MKPRSAFTLMELLMYLGIATIVILVVSKFMVDVSQNAARNRASLELQSNARLVTTRITQNIRTATPPVIPSSSTSLTLATPSGTYIYAFDPVNHTVTESVNGGSALAMTSGSARVNGLTFTSQAGGVQIDLIVDSATTMSPAVPTQHIITTAIPRRQLY